MIVLLSLCGAAYAEKPWEQLSYPPLKEIKVPEVARYEFDNGLVLFLLEDREFPLIDVRASLRAGGAFDPADKAGLASITAVVLRNGGTESFPGDDLDVYLESIGAQIELTTENDRVIISASFLSEYDDDILMRLADLLRRPAFPEDKIELAEIDQRTAIAARNDQPFDIALREYRKVVYGPESPYARHTEYATIEAIERDDLLAFHGSYYRPDGLVLIITGDFKKKDMKKRVERLLGGWKQPREPLPEPPAVPEMQPRGIYYAEKTDVTQSTILLGHLGFRVDDPDYPEMRILNEILGGGFSSRIMNEIRTKRGLAYMANSIPGYAYPRPGIFGAIAGTKSESTLVAIQLLEEEIRKVAEEPVTEVELERARSGLLNSFVFEFDTRSEVANRVGFFEFYGYPLDFLAQYQQGLREATPQSILEAAKRKIHPGKLSILVIGNKAQFSSSLSELGEVVELDISIPEPPSKLEIPEATEESRQRAREILTRAAQIEGGKEMIAELKSLKVETDAKISMQGMTFNISSTEIQLFPDHQYSSQILPFGQGTAVQVFTGDAGWMKDPRGLQDMPEDQLVETKADQLRDRIRLLAHYENMDLQALDPIEEDRQTFERVFVATELVKDFILFFDKEGRLVRMDYQGKGPQGPVKASMRYSVFTEESGIGFPSTVELYHDGELFLTGTLKSVEVNPEVDMTIFEKPTE